jgi:hypothetical protein
MGRPARVPGEPATRRLDLRLTELEWQRLTKLAEANELSRCDLARAAINDLAEGMDDPDEEHVTFFTCAPGTFISNGPDKPD